MYQLVISWLRRVVDNCVILFLIITKSNFLQHILNISLLIRKTIGQDPILGRGNRKNRLRNDTLLMTLLLGY